MKHPSSKASNILTQNIFGSQLQQILELEIDVNNGHAASDGQDDKVIAVDVLKENAQLLL